MHARFLPNFLRILNHSSENRQTINLCILFSWWDMCGGGSCAGVGVVAHSRTDRTLNGTYYNHFVHFQAFDMATLVVLTTQILNFHSSKLFHSF